MKFAFYCFITVWYLVFVSLSWPEKKMLSNKNVESFHKVYLLDEHYKKHIRTNIIIGLTDKKRQWTKKKIDHLTEVIFTGQKEYNIDAVIVLSLISIESRYKITARNKNYEDNFDYGLTQINSKNVRKLVRQSIRVLDKHNIRRESDSIHDVAINVMCCFVHLDGLRSELVQKEMFNRESWVKSYNVGVRGLQLKKFQERRELYYKKFLEKEKIYVKFH